MVGLGHPVAAADPSPGCGRPAPARAPDTFLVGGIQRRAIVVVPDGYRPDRPLPLVLAFHGRTDDNARLRRYLALEREARTATIFVYPAARRGRSGGFTWATPDGDDPDLALFDGVAAGVAGRYCVDRSAVFLGGHSLGATFANDLACARAPAVAAVATVAGGISLGRCAGRAPALLLHNPRDGLVPLAEGERARDALLGAPIAAGLPVAEVLGGFACLRAGGAAGAAAPLLWCLHREDSTARGRYYPHQWPQGASRLVMSFFAGLTR
jgi:polyhydroxybutyrate depolymerase